MTASVSPRTGRGLLLALGAALSFSLSGTLAKSLQHAGWTSGAAVLARIWIGALVLIVPGLIALGGRWHLLRTAFWRVLVYGMVAIAGCQLAYFHAVALMPVGIALLVEYTSPVGVVVFLWLFRGKRPTWLTALGAVICAGGLVLALDVLGHSGGVNPRGVMFSLIAMLGAVTYFILGDDSGGLPAITFAALGLTLGGIVLGLAGLVGIVPVHASTQPVTLGERVLPYWVVAGLLGVVTAASAYWLGIMTVRALGPRLAAFASLSEVLCAIVYAWVLLGEATVGVQALGALIVLAGVVVVKLGEPADVEPGPVKTLEP